MKILNGQFKLWLWSSRENGIETALEAARVRGEGGALGRH